MFPLSYVGNLRVVYNGPVVGPASEPKCDDSSSPSKVSAEATINKAATFYGLEVDLIEL